ncbi:MAG: metal-dependent hydrolase [Pyrinomonadaceae bacterium]
MDNLTHSLTGLIVAKTGIERLSPAATTVCVITANAPDLDGLILLTSGRWTYLQHHRGITHSIAGTLVLIFLVPSICYAGDLALAQIRKRPGRLRYGPLLLASSIAGVTHPIMDWTNNYGVRLLLPWSGKWFYGDLVFIIDPLLWIVLGGAGYLLTSRSKGQSVFWVVLALILTAAILFIPQQREVFPHRTAFRVVWMLILGGLFLARRARLGDRLQSSLAIGAIAIVVLYWSALGMAHHRAYGQALAIANQLAMLRGETIVQVAAMPTLADPFHWQCISDTDRAIYRFQTSIIGGPPPLAEVERFEKPKQDEQAAIATAAQDDRAMVLLGFARFPVARVKNLDCIGQTVVQFADLRYTEPGGARRGVFALNVEIACPAKTKKVEQK